MTARPMYDSRHPIDSREAVVIILAGLLFAFVLYAAAVCGLMLQRRNLCNGPDRIEWAQAHRSYCGR